jgi:hypothetical protein
MDWLRSEDLKEEKNVTAPTIIIAVWAGTWKPKGGFPLPSLMCLACLIVVDVPHQVAQRGNARRFILANDADRNDYLDVLQRYSQLHQLETATDGQPSLGVAQSGPALELSHRTA